jgi:hypothetical protein
LFSIKSRVASLGNIPIKVSNNLFDKLVQPVLTYNAEISFMDFDNTKASFNKGFTLSVWSRARYKSD